jgi:type IV pilus assembly protein PilO
MNAFKALPFWAQVLVTVLLMGGLGFGGYSFLISDKIAEVKKKEKKLNELNIEVQKGLNLEKKLPELQREIASLEEQLNQLKTILPPVRRDSELVQKIEQLAKRSRLTILSIVPQRLRQKEFYDEYPIQISVLANYHDLAKFFDRMSGLQRIFNVGGVKMTQRIQRSTTIAANFTAVTFIYVEGRQAPAAAKGKPKKGAKKPTSLKDDA